MTLLAVAVAGAAGAVARYLVGVTVQRRRGDGGVRWSTLLVNVTGSFLLGVLIGAGSGWTTVAGTGFLGGYTTFSTFAIEVAGRVDEAPWQAAALAVAHVVAAALAAGAGIAVSG